MGSDGEGGGSEAVVARKGRKRQLVLESSDSEADEFYISTRQKAAAAAVGNAGAGGRGGGDTSGEKVVVVGHEKHSGAKSTEGDDSDKNKGDQPNRSNSQPDPKRIRSEAIHGGGGESVGSVSKDGTGGRMLRPGFPKWRFEKPEVRAGRVLDEKGGAEMKASSGSKVKEPMKHEKRMLLKTDQSNLVDSGRQEVIRVQGKSGVLKILPKNNKVVKESSDGILPKKTKVDGGIVDGKILLKNAKVEETGDGKILTKGGVLKLLPKNNKVVRETSDGKVRTKNIKVDGETENGRILTKNSKVDGETSDGKIPTKNTKVDRGTGDDKVLKSCTVDLETGAGKIPARNNKADGETSDGYRRVKEKNSVLDEFQKQDTNGQKRVTEKLVSSIILRKSDPSVVGVSLGQRMKQKNSKAQLKISSLGHYPPSSSLKYGKIKLGEHKNEKKRLLEHKGSPENLSKKAKSKVTELQGTSGSALKKHGMKKPREGPRNSIKQKLRDQIKQMLLDNGWKIDLRRRKSKDYEDSVYVSPQGTGYWSITKAYAVFQEQFKNQHDEQHTGCSSELNNLESSVAGASCHAISKDDLAMLQRNVLKRRTRKELNAAEKKYGDNRSRNLKDTFAGKSSRNKYQNNEDRVKIKHGGCALLVRGSTHNMEDDMDDYIPYQWRRTVLSWMIDLGVVSEDAKVKYINKKGTRARLEGRITREGIYCGCCSKILTIAKFELHAGSKEQQPYTNIFLEDGEVSLLQCLLDAWEKQARYEKKGFYKIDPGDDPDDDSCGICGDGGNLLCCDRCTSTFHLACLGIKMPSGDWYCRSCICRFCSSAQERTSSLLSCLQCSRKYHQVCAPGTGKDPVCTKPGTSIDCFCSPGCRKIYKQLKKLLGVKNDMEAGFSWSLVRCFPDSEAAPPKKKAQLVHCNSKTAVAFSVMDECFLPRIDERSGINIIHNVVYNCGSDFNRLNFSGFYTFILERGDEVMSAATVRIHGTDLAEMPFIGTRGLYRRQGMCHRLLNAIESVLCSLNVRRLVMPAIPELQNTWTTVFGFKPVEPSKKQKIKSVNLLIFHGTGLLEKRLLPTGTVNRQTTAGTVNAVGCDRVDAQTFGEATGSLTPVHASREFAVGDLGIKDHDNSCALIGSSAGLTSNQPPAPEEKTPERTSPLSIDDVNLHTVPGVGEDNMQCKAEPDNTQEVKYAETDGILIAENIAAEQKPEDKSNSSYASAVPVTVDPCSCSSNELGKGENCASSQLFVEAVLVRDGTEPNMNSNSISGRIANEEDKKSSVDPLDTVNVRSTDAYTTKDQTIVSGVTKNAVATTEDHSVSAVDPEVSMERYVQLKDEVFKDKTGSLFPDLKRSSISKIMLEKSNETKSVESDKIEMKETTIDVGITVESSNEAGITVSALDMSNDICGEVMAKPTLTCGEGQIHGEDKITVIHGR